MTEETAAAPAPEPCENCGHPKLEHKLADDCQPAGDPADLAGTNPFGMTRGQLRRYRPEHQRIVLEKGPTLVGVASAIGDCNQAVNQILRTAHNLRHLRAPCQTIVAHIDHMLQHICQLHEWDLQKDVLGTLEEMRSATALACPGNPDGNSRRILLPN
jgi:ribosomal protein L32